MDVITYTCWDLSESVLVKVAPELGLTSDTASYT